MALTECAGLLANARRIGSVHRSPLPESMEYYGQNFGLILYSTVLPGDYGTGFLKLKGVHDRAYLYVDGALKKVFDRTRTRGCDFSVVLAGLRKGSRIDILVDALGRVNYGEHLYDRKGIESVMFNNQTLMDFEVVTIPLDDFSGLDWSAGREEKHRFYRGNFSAASQADCFVDMRGFGKGYVWVNGFNLGRYWSVGPQKTLYLPGVRLRVDAPNEIVILDLESTGKTASVSVTDRHRLG